ncbi:Trichohyalin [Balamuthia mandrillaris]
MTEGTGSPRTWSFDSAEGWSVDKIKERIRSDVGLKPLLMLGKNKAIISSPEKLPPGRYWVKPCPSSTVPGRPPVPALPFECFLSKRKRHPTLNQDLHRLCNVDQKVVALDTNVLIDLVDTTARRKRQAVARKVLDLLKKAGIQPVLTTTVLAECAPAPEMLARYGISPVCSTPRGRDFSEEMHKFVSESRLPYSWKAANKQDFRIYGEALFLKRHLGSNFLGLVSSNLRFALRLSFDENLLQKVFSKYPDMKPVSIWSLGDALNRLEDEVPKPLRDSRWACWKCCGQHHDQKLCVSSDDISHSSHQARCALCLGTGHSPDRCARHRVCGYCRASGHNTSCCSVRETQFEMYDEFRATEEKLRSTEEKLRSTEEKLRSTEEKLRSTEEKLRSTEEKLRRMEERLSLVEEENVRLREAVLKLQLSSAAFLLFIFLLFLFYICF